MMLRRTEAMRLFWLVQSPGSRLGISPVTVRAYRVVFPNLVIAKKQGPLKILSRSPPLPQITHLSLSLSLSPSSKFTVNLSAYIEDSIGIRRFTRLLQSLVYFL